MEQKSKLPALFGTQQNYEKFQLEWSALCYLINPSKANRKKLEKIVCNKVKE